MTPAEKAFVLAHASVPEQIVSLMSLISRGDAFLMEDYLGFAGENWLIVGYPLQNPFSAEQCGRVVEQAVQESPARRSAIHRAGDSSRLFRENARRDSWTGTTCWTSDTDAAENPPC